MMQPKQRVFLLALGLTLLVFLTSWFVGFNSAEPNILRDHASSVQRAKGPSRNRRKALPANAAPKIDVLVGSNKVHVRLTLCVKPDRAIIKRSPYPWQKIKFQTGDGVPILAEQLSIDEYVLCLPLFGSLHVVAETLGFVSTKVLITIDEHQDAAKTYHMELRPSATVVLYWKETNLVHPRCRVFAFKENAAKMFGSAWSRGVPIWEARRLGDNSENELVVQVPRGVKVILSTTADNVMRSFSENDIEMAFTAGETRVCLDDFSLAQVKCRILNIPPEWREGQRVSVIPTNRQNARMGGRLNSMMATLDSEGVLQFYVKRPVRLTFGLQMADGTTLQLQSMSNEKEIAIADDNAGTVNLSFTETIAGVILEDQTRTYSGVVMSPPTRELSGDWHPYGSEVAIIEQNELYEFESWQVRTEFGDFDAKVSRMKAVGDFQLYKAVISRRDITVVFENQNKATLVLRLLTKNDGTFLHKKLVGSSRKSIQLSHQQVGELLVSWSHGDGWSSKPAPLSLSESSIVANDPIVAPKVRTIEGMIRGLADWPEREELVEFYCGHTALRDVRKDGSFRIVASSVDEILNTEIQVRLTRTRRLFPLGVSMNSVDREHLFFDLGGSDLELIEKEIQLRMSKPISLIGWMDYKGSKHDAAFRMPPLSGFGITTFVPSTGLLTLRGALGTRFYGLLYDARTFSFVGWIEGDLFSRAAKSVQLKSRVVMLESESKAHVDVYVRSTQLKCGNLAGWITKLSPSEKKTISIPATADVVLWVRKGVVLRRMRISPGEGRIGLRF